MAASDATPFPIKNQAYRVTFPILDNDGDLVTAAAGLDSEISKDGGTFADCTAEATEIATSSGMYYLDLTATEMNADTVAIIVKTTTSDAKTTPIVLYPVESTDIPVNVKAISDDTVAADNLELDYDGTGYAKAASTIGTTTTNTDMRGTDSAALATVCTEARLAELDAANMPADIDAIPTTAMRGTDSAALASVCTEARLAELDAANIPADIDAIPTTAMRGTDSAALASVCTEARLAELDAANIPADLAAAKAVADKLDDTLEDDSGTYRFTENALEEAPAGGGGGDATEANQTTIIDHLTDVKGTGFVKDTNSLTNVTGASPVNIDHDSTQITSG